MSGTITGTLAHTQETQSPTDPNYPIPPGYSYYTTIYGCGFQTFDFGRNIYYALINQSGPGHGIAITDLSTMDVIRTATLNTMYSGTPYGSPPGSPPSGSAIWDIVTGSNTDVYLLVSPDKGHQYFIRVDPVTFKVTGQLFSFGGHDLLNGMVNKTATHTIVGYATHPAYHLGLFLLDGTGIAAIGYAATPVYTSYNTGMIPGPTHGDGSCDFIMIDSDIDASGLINIWRIKVSDSLVITSTITGTFDANTVYAPGSGPNPGIGQMQYDTANDAIILWLQNTINGPPTWLTSVNWDGSVNWSTYLNIGVAPSPAPRGQAQLTGSTLMVGSYNTPLIIDTITGSVIYTGALAGIVSMKYFEVWDASRSSWWIYGAGFTRIDFIETPRLAMDNVICGTSLARAGDICLDWSNDRGHTFGNPVCQPFGDFLTSLQWQRLGMARDRVFRLTWWSGVHTALQGAWVTAITGDEDNEMKGG